MSLPPRPGRASHVRARPFALSVSLVAFLLLALVTASGCGGSTSKPAYCSDRSNLEQAIKDLPSAVKGGAGDLQLQVTTIQDDVTQLTESARSDFPEETSALDSSVKSLKAAIDGLGSSPSASDLAPLVVDVGAVVSAAKGFSSATKSKC